METKTTKTQNPKKFYKLPATLITSGLSPRAILCYCVLADRAALSSKSDRYKDADGVYIIYPVAELAATLGTGERTTRYALAELEDTGYIKTHKQGKKAPQKIYITSADQVTGKILPLTSPSDRQDFAAQPPSDRQDSAAHDRQDFAAPYIYTDTNKTNTSSKDTPPEEESSLPQLLAIIDQTAAEMGRRIDDRGRIKALNKYRKAKDVTHPAAWLAAVVRNMSPDELYGSKGDKPAGFGAGYSIEDYESTSVLDYDWDDD